MYLAAMNGHFKVVRVLLEHEDADANRAEEVDARGTKDFPC